MLQLLPPAPLPTCSFTSTSTTTTPSTHKHGEKGREREEKEEKERNKSQSWTATQLSPCLVSTAPGVESCKMSPVYPAACSRRGGDQTLLYLGLVPSPQFLARSPLSALESFPPAVPHCKRRKERGGEGRKKGRGKKKGGEKTFCFLFCPACSASALLFLLFFHMHMLGWGFSPSPSPPSLACFSSVS